MASKQHYKKIVTSDSYNSKLFSLTSMAIGDKSKFWNITTQTKKQKMLTDFVSKKKVEYFHQVHIFNTF